MHLSRKLHPSLPLVFPTVVSDPDHPTVFPGVLSFSSTLGDSESSGHRIGKCKIFLGVLRSHMSRLDRFLILSSFLVTLFRDTANRVY